MIGIDVVSVARLRRALLRTDSFAELVYTAKERELAATLPDARRPNFLAGRFAVKEAVLKALGVGIDRVAMTDIEVLQHGSGAPAVQLHGEAQREALRQDCTHCEVSISHDAGIAVGVATFR